MDSSDTKSSGRSGGILSLDLLVKVVAVLGGLVPILILLSSINNKLDVNCTMSMAALEMASSVVRIDNELSEPENLPLRRFLLEKGKRVSQC